MAFPKAVLFGSIGTLAETSELQRQAFNQAFAACGMDWHWDVETYRALLKKSGGLRRVASYAEAKGQPVDAAAVHAVKTKIYHQLLENAEVAPRDGVLELMSWARKSGVQIGLVSTTSKANIERLLSALGPAIDERDFDFIGDGSMVTHPKPSGDIYELALQRLGLTEYEVVAVEDTAESLRSATAASVATIAFPGANAQTDDFSAAALNVGVLTPAAITSVYDIRVAQGDGIGGTAITVGGSIENRI
ncbi:HAD superfamily hydrolase (TIGR01509 family) [Roseibium hamelinense]|uniref:HAD superfamily hydrolase (TIGR01509 family) n=1 Tax=Roseibium hamelinense TaxID=150831 RepID=A0A562TIF6_9HYPH|nr:HAD-IA family hydrolase [Roseibium hamelinense]MTI42746.1 HAD family hydrolase [Roseibium hamelinense]TWI93392.1 HAD superfamily hydrolase (TIGR01509 family) [Roseibium hamelinense]